MRVLHISDIHYRAQDAQEIDRLVAAASLDAAALATKLGPPDLIIFSGDLTYAGTELGAFVDAYDRTIKRIADAVGVTSDRVLLAPGNHDISRPVALSGSGIVEHGMRQVLTSRDALNEFVRDTTFGNVALARMEPFFAYTEVRCQSSRQHRDPFVDIHKFQIDDQSVCVALFNSAWRSAGAGESERKQLLIGDYIVQKALQFVVDADVRCAVIHHPFEWLCEFDRVPSELAILRNFDIIFHGHVHTSFPEARTNATGGTLVSQAGCLYDTQLYANSYQFLDLDLLQQRAAVHIRTWYESPNGQFGPATAYRDGGALQFGLKLRSRDNQTATDRILTLGRGIVRQRAGEQATMSGEAAVDISLVFVCPPLERRSENTSTPDLDSTRTDGKESLDGVGQIENNGKANVELAELLSSGMDLVLLGGRQSGKSTLGHYVALCAADGKVDTPRVPAVVDMRKVAFANDINKGIKAYFTHENFDASEGQLLQELATCHEHCNFLIILDNFDINRPHHLAALRRMKALGDRFRWILLCDQPQGLITSITKLREILSGAEFISILPLPTRLIREMTSRRLATASIADQSLVDVVIDQFHRSDLPRNGHVVSMLLSVSRQKLKVDRVNHAELLRALTDYLLERADFTQAVRGSFDATLKELLLQQLAARLKTTNDIEDSQSLLAFLREFLRQKGLAFDSVEVLRTLCDSGILSKENDYVGFRYRSFQEYYHALYILNNDDIYTAIKDGSELRYYEREVDIITALKRESKGVDTALRAAIDSLLSLDILNAEGCPALIDLGYDTRRRQYVGRRAPVLATITVTQEMIDDLQDKSDEKLKATQLASKSKDATSDLEQYAEGKSDAEIGETWQPSATVPRTISHALALTLMLATVARNSEFDDLNIKAKSARYCFRAMAVCLTRIFKHLEEDLEAGFNMLKTRRAELTRSDFDAAFNFAKLIMPVVVSCVISDAMATANLIAVLDSIANDANEILECRLLVGFVLTDLGHPASFGIVRRVLSEMKKPFYTLLAYERLTIRFLTQFMREPMRGLMINLIADLEADLGSGGFIGQLTKGQRISKLYTLQPEDPGD